MTAAQHIARFLQLIDAEGEGRAMTGIDDQRVGRVETAKLLG
jgi:hypothetical protein